MKGGTGDDVVAELLHGVELVNVFTSVRNLLFRRRPQQPTGPQGGPEGQQVTRARTPALNLFQDGDNLDLYVYISELETFSDFDDPESLVWVKEDIVYGDWTSGPDSDGTFYHSLKIPTTEVRILG